MYFIKQSNVPIQLLCPDIFVIYAFLEFIEIKISRIKI